MVKYKVLNHSSIKITNDNVNIYFDPYLIENEAHDADIIFITHSHFDHYSKEDIDKIINDNTMIIMPLSMKNNDYINSIFVEPDKKYIINDINVETTYSYNDKKNFHKKSDLNCGYVITLDGSRYYVMGDTDENKDILKIKADYIFIPIGGKYTFDETEAANYINKVKPKVAIYTHLLYNDNPVKAIENFKKLVNNSIEIREEI